MDAKKNELAAHESDDVKPQPAYKPIESDQNAGAALDQATLEEKKGGLVAAEMSIGEERQTDVELAKKEAGIAKVEKQIENIESLVKESIAGVQSELDILGIDSEDLLKLNVDVSILGQKRDEIVSEREKISRNLNAEEPDSLASKRDQLTKDIASLSAKLSEPQQKYQTYLEAHAHWEKRREEIVGDVDIAGTITYFQDQLTKVGEEFPNHRKELNRKRLKASLKIYREKLQLRRHYAKYYGSVQEYLDSYPIESIKNFRIKFDVSISQWGFAEDFLRKINRNYSAQNI